MKQIKTHNNQYFHRQHIKFKIDIQVRKSCEKYRGYIFKTFMRKIKKIAAYHTNMYDDLNSFTKNGDYISYHFDAYARSELYRDAIVFISANLDKKTEDFIINLYDYDASKDWNLTLNEIIDSQIKIMLTEFEGLKFQSLKNMLRTYSIIE